MNDTCADNPYPSYAERLENGDCNDEPCDSAEVLEPLCLETGRDA